MNSTTLERSPVSRTVDPIALSLTKAMTLLVSGLNALDKKLRERPASIGQHAADLLRLAESYEESQPSYAADLRAAALTAMGQHSEAAAR
jgi:hypothetical protein